MRLHTRSPVLTALLAASLFARAAAADPGLGEQAARLAQEGQAALDAKDWATAADRFTRAEALARVPFTLGLARAQVGLGKWLLARRSYERALQEGASATPDAALRAALDEARRELDLLVLRIPSLTLQLTGAPASEILLDGVPVPAGALTPLPVDPGKHTLRARAAGAGGGAVTLSVTVDEGRHETVTLELSPGASAPLPPPKPASPPPLVAVPSALPAAPLAPLPAAPSEDGSGQRIVSYVTFGLGGVGLLVGTITAVVAVNQHADLERICVDDRCPVSAVPKLESYRTVGTASTVSFLAGGMGVAAGAILFFTAPRGKAKPALAPTLGARMGLGTLSLRGTF